MDRPCFEDLTSIVTIIEILTTFYDDILTEFEGDQKR